jgi:HTH-type transcriptional regulator / antitoxin HipB
MDIKSQIIISTIEDLGKLIRNKRKKNSLTQAEAAAFCKVGTRFFSDLENGKKSLQMGKVLQVLQAFGFNLAVEEKGLPTS